jgi:hypothetical protein
MAFSCLSLSSSRDVAVVCSSYAVRCICCCMSVLVVLCWRLNMYYAYLPSHRSHPNVEVRVLEVGHGLKVLMPYEVLLIPNR